MQTAKLILSSNLCFCHLFTFHICGGRFRAACRSSVPHWQFNLSLLTFLFLRFHFV